MKATLMNKVFTAILSTLIGWFLLIGSAQAQSSSLGKEFYFSFAKNSETPELTVYITSKYDTQGVISIDGKPSLGFINKPFTVLANSVTTIQLPSSVASDVQQLTNNQIKPIGIRISAKDDIGVYALNAVTYSTDAFIVLPVEALGLEYIAQGYSTSWLPGFLAITAPYDQTQVTIKPKISFSSGQQAGQAFTINLNKGDVYYATSNDITGTQIVATSPISVQAGVERTAIKDLGSSDHIAETMIPVSTWGKYFLTVPLANRTRGDTFRILASQDNTQIRIKGSQVATINAGNYHEMILSEHTVIETNLPVQLLQYSHSSGYDGVISDPFSMLIPPTEQFLSNYVFSTLSNKFQINFVNVVVPSGESASLRLDGQPINELLFSSIGSSGFSSAKVPITTGSHSLTSLSNTPFGINVYGYSTWDSYGYPGGMSFEAINPFGDPYLPNARLIQVGETIQGLATDSEDVNANGILDAGEDLNGDTKIGRRSEDINGNGKLDIGEDLNGNGILDRDTGIFKIEFLADSANLKLDVLAFVPGSLSVPFSITRLDATKPGTGILRIQDGAGNKTEFPISIGGNAVLQNVRVIETLSTSGLEIDLASFQKQPFSITDGAAQKVIEWRFDSFNANAVADLGFDVIFKNPIPGENRLVSHKLELLYNDVNGKPVRTELGSRFVDVYPTNLTIAPSTDKPSYGAGEAVLITSLVKNLSSFTGAVAVKLSIQDAQQRSVAALGTLPTQTVVVDGTNTFNGLNFNVANTLAGNYRVVAELLDAGGNPIAVGAAPFVIFTAGGAQLQSSITTDKRIYAPLNNVQISDRITNTLTNTALDNLKIITTVTNPDGTMRFTKTEALLQLLPSATRDYGYTLPLTAAAAGQYNAVLTVTKADGTQLSQSTTQFTVSSSADTGAGLIGQISVNPKIANNGQTVGLIFSATNNGNSTMTNVPLTVRIVDPEKQIVVKEFAFTTTLAIGDVFNQSGSWIANVLAGTNLVAVLEATVGGRQQVLAQAPFTVLKLDVVQTTPTPARVLVLVSCKNHDEGHHDKDDDERSCSKPDDEHDEDEDHSKTCVSDRANTIKQELTALGVSHTVVTNTTEFKRALRSGLYNTYWISGKQYKLHDDLADEIREAVFSGDRLILDGVHDERNKVLDQVAGITYRGKLGNKGLEVNTAGSLFAAQQLPTVGQALKVIANGGQAVAAFEGGGHHAHGGHNASSPAILTNDYGQGKAIMFAFDYVSSLRAQALWKPVLADSLQYLLPIQSTTPSTTFTPGALLPVKTSITNQGAATGIQVKMTLPALAAVLGSNPTGVLDTATNSISWAFDLPAMQTKDLFLTLRVPPTAGDFELQTRVSTVTDGVANLYGDPIPLAFKVVNAAQNSADVKAQLLALVLTSRKDLKLRQDLLSDLQNVMAAFNKNTNQGYETAIHEIIEMIEDMASSTSVNKPAIRLALDAILKEAQWRLSLLPTTGKRDDYEHRDHKGHR